MQVWTPKVAVRQSRRGGAAGVALSLTFLVLLFVGFVADSPSATSLALSVLALAAFVGLYVVVFLRGQAASNRRVALTALGIMLALTIALVALGDGQAWLPLFVYVAALAGRTVPDLAERGGVLAIACLAAVVGFASHANSGFVLSIALTTFAIGYMLVGFARLLAANKELREAQDEIARLAASEERLRIARDVHDLIGHDLSTIALKTELAQRLLADEPECAAAELADVEAVTRRALEEVRGAVHGYREASLAAELAGAQAMLASAGIDVAVEEEAGALPADVETVFAWAVREGATNIARHSGARRAAFRVRRADDDAELEIEDDGAGANGSQPGSGLSGLAERAAGISGRVEAGPRPGGGFRLRVDVPVPRS
jgi:two-component system sensor histidine kinase DesK